MNIIYRVGMGDSVSDRIYVLKWHLMVVSFYIWQKLRDFLFRDVKWLHYALKIFICDK